MITVEQVRARVDKLKANHADDEGAHITDDAIRQDVLEAIRDGSPDARELAAIALETDDLDFSRWYA